jgi:hypothetical protein
MAWHKLEQQQELHKPEHKLWHMELHRLQQQELHRLRLVCKSSVHMGWHT